MGFWLKLVKDKTTLTMPNSTHVKVGLWVPTQQLEGIVIVLYPGHSINKKMAYYPLLVQV